MSGVETKMSLQACCKETARPRRHRRRLGITRQMTDNVPSSPVASTPAHRPRRCGSHRSLPPTTPERKTAATRRQMSTLTAAGIRVTVQPRRAVSADRSPPTAIADRPHRLGATSGSRRRSRRGRDSVDSPTRPSSFRRPLPHDSIEEENVFLPAAATVPDDAQPTAEDRRRYEVCNATNLALSLSLYFIRQCHHLPLF